MIEIERIEPGLLGKVSRLLVDIDDTLSTHGKLTAGAFSALWRLYEAGIDVAVVTGRPAGWCDHIARFWPVKAVIGENGAFYFFHDGKKLCQRFVYAAKDRQLFRDKLNIVRDEILRQVPGSALASDQPYRESDVAIDFCEDVPRLDWREILRIKSIFEKAGAHAKISSIHVNGWFGEFDKLSTARLWASERLNSDLEKEADTYVYCGDSPNDEPMFRFFPLSFGVANVRPFLSRMAYPPAFICQEECGAGFSQVVEKILAVRCAVRS